MKPIARTLFIFFLSTASVYAGNIDSVAKLHIPKSLTLSFGYLGGSNKTHGGFLGIASTLHSRHEFGLSGILLFRRPPDMPADFNCGCIHGNPNDLMVAGVASYGYVIYPAVRQNWLKLTLRGGIMAGQDATRTDFGDQPTSTSRHGNYEYNDKYNTSFAVFLNPTAAIEAKEHYGLSFGPYLLFHPRIPVVGVFTSFFFSTH